MKPVVMHLVTTLNMGGAERLSLAVIQKNKEHFNGIIASLYGVDGDLALCAKSMDIPSVGLDAKGGRIKSIYLLYKALRKYKVDLLHVQAGYLLLFAFPAAKLANIRLVYTEHALHSIQKYSNIRKGIQWFSPFMQGISCVNHVIKDYFVNNLRLKSTKVQVIENGVDTTLFSPTGTKAILPWQSSEQTPPKGAEENLFIFGSVARLTEAKDHPNLLQAFALVNTKYPYTRLVIVGDGEERQNTQKCIADLGLEDCVHITGKKLNIAEYLRSMDSFVMSSQREGLPVAILEAMACALPVISTDVGSIATLNGQDETQKRLELVPAKNSKALATAMEEILINTLKTHELAQRAHQFILTEKADTTMAKAYLKLYKEGGLTCPS